MSLRVVVSWVFSVAIGVASDVQSQADLKTVEEHVKAAETAAGPEYRALFAQLCAAPAPPDGRQGQRRRAGAAGEDRRDRPIAPLGMLSP